MSPLAAEVVETWPIQNDMVGRQAIPVPVGFVIGGLAAVVLLVLKDRRRRPKAAIPRSGEGPQ